MGSDVEKQLLLSRLISAVKEVQIRYGGKGVVATESDKRVVHLCKAWEQCVIHGLKVLPSTDIQSNASKDSISTPKESSTEQDFRFVLFDLLEKIGLRKHSVGSNAALSWISRSLCERTLEQSLNNLISDSNLLSKHYEEWALLKDEQNYLLKNMASGLASIAFSISASNLNDEHPADNPELRSQRPNSHVRNNSADISELQKHSQSEKSPGIADKNTSHFMTTKQPAVDESNVYEKELNIISRKLRNSKSEASMFRARSSASLDSEGSDCSSFDDIQISGLYPVSHSGERLSFMVYLNEKDAIEAKLTGSDNSWSDTSMQGLSLASKARSLSKSSEDGRGFPDDSVTSIQSMSLEELKQAIITLMVRKDQVEEENKILQTALSIEEFKNKKLKNDLDQTASKLLEQTKSDQSKIQSIIKDNELLKFQLKKYINDVNQLQKKGSDQGASNSDVGVLCADATHGELMPYKRKLIQVAEMHGELLEFNEFLQRQVIIKDNCIKKLLSELVQLRGPLMVGLDQVCSDTELVESNKPLTVVNIWMPSTFLTRSGTSSYHIYQIFIRIKDEEWNIYKRYSQFHSFYKSTKKLHPLVSSFNFPPKKSLGHKEKAFVEERRFQLQTFLRKTIQYIIKSDSELYANLSKSTLTTAIPFLS